MTINEDIQKDVQDALKWEPALRAAEIGVIVNDGVVTLTGTVDSYTKKSDAEEAAKGVAGVKAVIEEIKVHFGNSQKKMDSDIVHDIFTAFRWNWEIPNDKINVMVEDGWVTLTGELRWNYQREAVKKVVKRIAGVTGITNEIIIKSNANDEIEKRDILQALARHWSTSDQDIHVSVAGNKVTLKGAVDSLYQKEQAERIAWNAPGVWLVANELDIVQSNKLDIVRHN